MAAPVGDVAELSSEDLARLSALIAERSGLAFGEARWPFLRNRAREAMARVGFTSARRWVEELAVSAERRSSLYCELEEALQVHETSFFRYEEHHQALREHVLPALVRTGGPRVRIASVGCSTGEEAYSIAITVRESGLRSLGAPRGRTDAQRPERPRGGSRARFGRDEESQAERVPAGMVDIVALDTSRQALTRAVAGTYPAGRLTGVPASYLTRYFVPGRQGFTVVPALRQMIRFRHHDIRRGFYIGKFDIIFCCNVLLYFTPAVKRQILERLAASLTEGGYLFLGHADGLTPPTSLFDAREAPAGFVYRRVVDRSSLPALGPARPAGAPVGRTDARPQAERVPAVMADPQAERVPAATIVRHA